MYKNLLRFSIFILIALILLSLYILIQLSAKNNIIQVTVNNYPKILDEVHSNIDKYIGKKISVSGYVYVQDDFQKENFVIAQNVILGNETLIIGFLCENLTDNYVDPFENVMITGKIEKCIYNGLQYPIIKIEKIA